MSFEIFFLPLPALISNIMKMIRYFLFVFSFLICFSCNNKGEIDVLDKIKSTGDTNPALAISMLDSIKSDMEEGSKYVRIKYMLLQMRLNDKAYIFPQNDDTTRIVVSYFGQNGSAIEKQEAYYYAGSVYRDLQDAPRALEYFMKSKEMVQNANGECDSLILRNTYSNIAMLFFYVQDYRSSLDFAKKEYEISCKMGKVTKNSLSHLADNYLHLDSINKVDSIAQVLENYIDKKNAHDVYGLLAIYSCTRNKQRADSMFHLIHQNSLKPDAIGYNALAEYYQLQDNIDSAIACYKKIIEGESDITYTYDAARFLFDLYQKKGNNMASLRCSEVFMKCSDSLDFGTRQELLATVKNQFQYYKDKEKEERIRKDNEKYHNRVIVLTISFLFIIAIFIILYYYKKNRYLSKLSNISNKLTAARQEKDRLDIESKQIEQELKSTRDSLNNREEELDNVKNDLREIEIELKYKEQLLSEKLEENKRFITLLHKADLEENAEDVILSIKNASSGKCRISAMQWQKIYHAIDELQPELMEKIMHNIGKFSEQQKQVCYLLSIGLTNSQIENLTDLPHVTVWRWVKKFDWI